jgi:hypothetical protein
VAPGTYTLTGVYKNTNAGISLKGQKSVTLVNGQTLDVGTFPLGNSTLEAGWDKYRNGSYTEAASSFKSYLDAVRSGQSTLGSTSAYSALGWTYGNGLDDPVKAMGYFHSAIDGWNGNSDAFAGLAGAELALLKADGIFHFNETIQGITSAIDLPGDYSSAPSHDMINEVDLKAFRAFANFLNGNTAGARSEASSIEASVNATGNDGSVDAIEIVLEFTK